MMHRTERKCLICNQKYYSPEQDDRHAHGRPPNAKISEAGGATIAESHPPTNIETKSPPSKIEVNPKKNEQPLSTLQDEYSSAVNVAECIAMYPEEKKIKNLEIPSFVKNKVLTKEQKKEIALEKKRATSREYQRKKRAAV